MIQSTMIIIYPVYMDGWVSVDYDNSGCGVQASSFENNQSQVRRLMVVRSQAQFCHQPKDSWL